MKINGFTLYSSGDSFEIEIWEQPVRRWVTARMYHWYDMRMFKILGYRALERWLQRHAKSVSYLSLTVRQDCRCYELAHKQRKSLGFIKIDEELYNQLANRVVEL